MIDQNDIRALRRLMELRDTRDASKKAADSAEKDYREAEADLYEQLTDPETGDIRRIPAVDLGEPWGRVSFSARETAFGRVIDEGAALEYFEKRAMVDEVSTPKFSMKRVNEIVRDCLEQGVNPPPGIDYYHRRGITITRQK